MGAQVENKNPYTRHHQRHDVLITCRRLKSGRQQGLYWPSPHIISNRKAYSIEMYTPN